MTIVGVVTGTSSRLGLSAFLSVGVVEAEKLHHGLHPENPWFHVIGRGFDSRHLHASDLRKRGSC